MMMDSLIEKLKDDKWAIVDSPMRARHNETIERCIEIIRQHEAEQPKDVVERIAKAIEEVAVWEKTPEKWSHAELVNPEDCAKAAIAAMRSDEIPVVDEAKGGQLMRAAYYRSDTYLRQEDYEGEKRFGPTQYTPKFSQSACWQAAFKAALDYIGQCEPKRESSEDTVTVSRDRYERDIDERNQLREKSNAEMLRVKMCEHIAEGEEGWNTPENRNICPSTMAVAELRDKYESAATSLEKFLSGTHQTALVSNLAMLVRRLCYKLKHGKYGHVDDIKVADQALEFLRCNNLQGSPLRTEIEGQPS